MIDLVRSTSKNLWAWLKCWEGQMARRRVSVCWPFRRELEPNHAQSSWPLNFEYTRTLVDASSQRQGLFCSIWPVRASLLLGGRCRNRGSYKNYPPACPLQIRLSLTRPPSLKN